MRLDASYTFCCMSCYLERETMEIFLTSIQSIVPIIVIIILGYFLQVRGWFQESFGNDLSKLIMNVAMPVAIFTSVLKYLTLDKLISLSGGLLYTFIAFILGYLAAFIAVKVFKVRPGRRGTMINTFVNANTIFIGLPLNNWKKLFPAPLLGFLVALVFLVLRIPVPSFAESTLTYIGSLTTPLSLVYIGIVLAKAGLKTIRFDKDTIITLVGRFILAPVIMLLVLKFFSPNMVAPEFRTFMIQSATPALAVLPILANQGKGDVEFSTNVVTLSTVLFVIVVPILQTLLG